MALYFSASRFCGLSVIGHGFEVLGQEVAGFEQEGFAEDQLHIGQTRCVCVLEVCRSHFHNLRPSRRSRWCACANSR